MTIEEKWVKNVFVINEERLAEAIRLTMDAMASLSEATALEWAEQFILSTKRRGGE